MTEAQSDAQNRASLPATAGSSPAGGLLYVGNDGNDSITVYDAAAAGNAAPRYVIAGPKTELDTPGQLSQDAQGNLYVANGNAASAGGAPGVLVFAHGAHGDAAPIRRLAGPLTGIHNVTAMTVDAHTGKIFVTDWIRGPFNLLSLLRFAPNSAGNVAPFARSSAFLQPAIELASDSTGNNVIAANAELCCSVAFAGVETAAKQFPNGAGRLVYEITNFPVGGVADDPATKSYVMSTGQGVYRVAEDTAGYGPADDGGTIKLTPKAIATISSDTCGGQLAVAPGANPDTYVVHSTVNGCSANAVYVYAHDAAGAAVPLRVLAGSATGLNEPYGIFAGR